MTYSTLRVGYFAGLHVAVQEVIKPVHAASVPQDALGQDVTGRCVRSRYYGVYSDADLVRQLRQSLRKAFGGAADDIRSAKDVDCPEQISAVSPAPDGGTTAQLTDLPISELAPLRSRVGKDLQIGLPHHLIMAGVVRLGANIRE